MDYYDMPQLDKSGPAYPPTVPYIPTLSPSTGPLQRTDINKFGVVSGDILTSCDWSAVIHRPAEDSEPEDLPSTVDTEAIKEPSTPLPPPLTPRPPTPAPVNTRQSESDDDSSASDSEPDSSSDSNSESQEGSDDSGSCTWSDSDSSESSGKPHDDSSSSSRSQSPPTTFSIRETNFDQGGLKLKISATKPRSKTVKCRAESSSSNDDSSSSEESEKDDKGKQRKGPIKAEEEAKEGPKPATVREASSPSKGAKPPESGPPKAPTKVESPPPKVKPSRKLPPRLTKSSPPEPPKLPPRRTRGRPPAKKQEPTKNKGVSGRSGSSSSEGSSEEEDEEEEEQAGQVGQVIQQPPPIPISEPLQVINEEDLAAILPDVGGGGSFDGFEDVGDGAGAAPGVSGSRAAAGRGTASGVTSSGSDVEMLPEQVVTEVIDSIKFDSDGSKPPPPPTTSPHNSDPDQMYSSNLLQQFVEKTEMLSRGEGLEDVVVRKRGRPAKPKEPPTLVTSGPSELDLVMRLDCSQSNVSPDSGIQSVAGSPPHHGLSPTPSPRSPPKHESKQPPCSNSSHTTKDKLSRLHTTRSPILHLENGGKRGPGRPKGSTKSGRKGRRGLTKERKQVVALPVSTAPLKVPPFIAGETKAVPPSLAGVPARRGPGRPKKTPPTLEPIVPIKAHPLGPKQHKHKKRKKHRRELVPDPVFVAHLEALAERLQKLYISVGSGKERVDSSQVPGVFRIKRTVKKRKGSERKTSDKESGTECEPNKEKQAQAQPVLTSTPSSTVKTQRRLKKGTLELSKNKEKPETNNEQRLPLKKRHYHMSNTNTNSPSCEDKNEILSDSKENKSNVKVSVHTTEKEKHSVGVRNINFSGKSINQVNSVKQSSVKMENQKKSEQNRSSSVENIPEAEIEKGAEHESVIVTPKKRHRLELDKKSGSSAKSTILKDKEQVSLLNCKRMINRINSNSNHSRGSSPQSSKRSSRLANKAEQEVVTVKTSVKQQSPSHQVHAGKRVSLRNIQEPAKQDQSEIDIPPKRVLRGGDTAQEEVPSSKEPAHLIHSEKERTHDKEKPIRITIENDKHLEKNKIVNSCSLGSLSTRSASKLVALNLLTVNSLISPIPADPEAKSPRPKGDKKPPAGVFEPSVPDSTEPLLTVAKLPELPTKPIGHATKAKSKLSVSTTAEDEDNHLPNNSKLKRNNDDKDTSVLAAKKPKVVCDVKIHVTKINADSLIKKVSKVVKMKLKRKKSINRTGFPVKKKKKKKSFDVSPAPPVLEDQRTVPAVLTMEESTPALSPVIKVEGVKTKEPVSEGGQEPLTKPAPKQETKSTKPEALEEQLESAPKHDLRPGRRRVAEEKQKIENERPKRRTEMEKSAEAESEQLSTVNGDTKAIPFKRIRKFKDDHEDSDEDSIKLRRKNNHPRWRKKFLPAGLFSDYYKEDEPRKQSENKTKHLSERVEQLMPPPAYCSKWVRQRRLPFQLPYDLWWLHLHNQLPGRDVVPSWNYKKIRTNFYYDVKGAYNYEAQSCNCKPSGDLCCGEDCINRMVFAECSPQLCPCRDNCSNQRIQRHEWAPGLVKFMTKDKGWGIKTKHAIKGGEFILEYVGEVVSEREFKSRMATRYTEDTHHYCLHLDGGLVIDGHRMGGQGRFVNHSCEPNCEMQKWSVNGLFRMALFAHRNINPNEELTYDYNFSLFNPAEGQPCKCGSSKCRGVIGGKSQRVPLNQGKGVTAVVKDDKPPGPVGRPRKSLRKVMLGSKTSKTNTPKEIKLSLKDNAGALATVAARLNHPPLKPLSQQQKTFILDHKCFLIRNLEKVNQAREKLKMVVHGGQLTNSAGDSEKQTCQNNNVKDAEVFLTQLTALSCPRSIRTRRLAQAQDNPEMTKTARLACIFKNLYTDVAQAKDETGELLSSHFVSLPSKKKFPLYYQRITNPIDLQTVEQNIVTGIYKTVESFDEDMTSLFKNNVRWYGRTSELGIAATRLRKIYNIAKLESIEKLKEILGEDPPPSFIPQKEDPGGEEEDVIRCICGLYKDEGVMIQCERCLVWQHCDCVKADGSVDHYLCEHCNPRQVDLEISVQVQPEYATPGQFHHITLLRGDIQIKQGDTVYVLRDIINEESTSIPKSKHNYKTIKNWKYTDCDIFKVERLWKDEKGERFAFGHHFLRPHETYHEPTRRFFTNELMRVPLYEVVPLELIMGHCFVLDLNTFCKGRPISSSPDHIYICEYRVDKSARLFAKVPKSKQYHVCTKSYAFEVYDQRLKPQRSYAPHGEVAGGNKGGGSTGGGGGVSRGRGGRSALHQTDDPVPVQPRPPKPQVKRVEKKKRLNEILVKLLSRQPTKVPMDLSYLLEPGRRQRKKPALLSS